MDLSPVVAWGILLGSVDHVGDRFLSKWQTCMLDLGAGVHRTGIPWRHLATLRFGRIDGRRDVA